jgi:ankyrin repeat protein
MKYFYMIIFSVWLISGCSSKLNYDLGYAAVVGDVEKMQDLIAIGAEVNSSAGKDETSPLENAINGGHIKAVKFLLENGADPNFSSSSDISPLFHAFSNGNSEIVNLLMNNGAKLKLPSRLDGFNDDIRRHQYDKNFLTLLKKAGYIPT